MNLGAGRYRVWLTFAAFAGLLWLVGCNAADDEKSAFKSAPDVDLENLDSDPVYGSTDRPNFSSNPPEASPPANLDPPRIKRQPRKKTARKKSAPRINKKQAPREIPKITARQPRLNPPPMIGDGATSTPHEDDEQPAMAFSMEDEQRGPAKIEVFFVTDRKSVVAIGNGDFLKTFKWPIVILLIASVLGLWSITQRKLIPGIVAVLVLFGGISVGYTSLIQWQRFERLASNGDVRYTHELKKINDDEEPLDYGKCTVNIPPDHRVGFVDSPSLQRFEFSEDAEKHVILERVIRGPKAEFFQDLNDRLEESSGHTFVFIHGYNVSFENAVKRTAQVSFDLKFNGVPICYSWPSHGGLEDYTRDMANADWTVVHLQQFLTSLFDDTGAKRIHVIAHSMGNRALMQALDRLSLQWHREKNESRSLAGGSESRGGNSIQELLKRRQKPQFGQIIMAAPDISADEFRQRYAKTLRELSDQITLYASSKDRALMVSTSVHGHNRAGLAGNDICVVEGIDTIDVSHVDTSLIGHSYYGDNPALINDLRALIQLSQSTSERQWLEQVEIASDKVYWKFR